jgi:mannitol/fructose-specific phosphotransferase system IIA component (Ntr-type)
MKLTDYIDTRHVLLDVEVSERDAVLRRIVEALAATGALTETEEPLRKLIEREEVMTTGIHPGIAVPHAYTPTAPKSVCALARVPGGAEFKSLDGGKVDLIFCLMGPREATEHHVRLLARIARLIELPGVVDDLKMAATTESLITLLRAAERRLP